LKFNILVTSAGVMSAVSIIKSLRYQKEFEVEIISTDADNYAPGLYLSDIHYVSPTIKKTEEYIDFFDDILTSGKDIKPRWKIKYNLINNYTSGNFKSDDIIIGDTSTDILAGNNLGIISVGVLCGLDERLLESNPTKVFSESIELMELFK